MIKIFSINEILDATNDFLTKPKEKKSKPTVSKKPLILNDAVQDHKKEISSLTSEDRKKFRKALGLDQDRNSNIDEKIKENLSDKSSHIKKNETYNHLNDNRKILSIEEKKEKENNEKIVDEVYKIIKKKVRKSTIKVILDQQTEINVLKEKILELRKLEHKNLKANKKLKNEIAILINNEKILNFKFEEFKNKLNLSIKKEYELNSKNEELENSVKELESSLLLTKEENIKLEKNYLSIQSQLDKFIVNEKNLIDSNKNIENNILILTNTKNSLAYEVKKLKHEFNIIQKNKELLYQNNQKLQKEVSLLTKNKNIIIEMNDKYQEQVSKLEAEKINFKENQISNDERVKILIEDKEKLIESNNKFKEENSKLINNESDLLKNKRTLEYELNSIKNKDVLIESKDEEKILKEMNTNLQYELKSIRANESKLIENNKKLHAELIKIRSSDNVKVHTNELKNLKEKLIFHQDENLRLSYDLSSAKKRYDIMKDQLGNIEMEKTNISKKIEDLSKTIEKTNIVESPFKKENESKLDNTFQENIPINNNKKKEVDINNEIKKIFIPKKQQILK